MNLPLPKTTQGVYRLSVSTFYFLQGLVFASWACRIPDIKNALGLNDADLGSVLFAVPVGQMSAMALSGYLVGRCGSRRILIAASIFIPPCLCIWAWRPPSGNWRRGCFSSGWPLI